MFKALKTGVLAIFLAGTALLVRAQKKLQKQPLPMMFYSSKG